MTTSSALSRLYTIVYRASYGAIMRRVGWLIAHSGPLKPTLLKLGYHLHNALVPHSYTKTMLNPVPVEGLRIYHDGHPLVERALAAGLYEPNVTRLFKELVKPGATVVDVGANIGYFTLLAARLAGENGAVWAFEPTPHLVQLIERSVAENGFQDRVHVVPDAVSDKAGTARLHVNVSETILSSLYEEAATHQVHERPGEFKHIDVTCVSLDDWAAQHGWPAVSLIKIDTEGGEKPALDGMVELSRRNPDLKLIVEFNVRTLQAAGATKEEFFAALDACGFTSITVIGDTPRRLAMPVDIPALVAELNRPGSEDSLNLLCEKTA